MSEATDILEELSRRGVVAQVAGETISLKPRASLDDVLLARVKEHKTELLAVLSRHRPALCSPTCYEVEQGKWIHHPWDGCKTPMPPSQPALIVEKACWHCGGSGECTCITCGHLESHADWKAGPCVPCRVRKQAQVQ
jgi:hypothetical protein